MLATHAAGFQVGLDTIVGFIPGVGDIALACVGIYIQHKAKELRLPRWRRSLIFCNFITDFLIGLIPCVGGLFNAWFACNRRNVNHILRHFGRVPGTAASLLVRDNAAEATRVEGRPVEEEVYPLPPARSTDASLYPGAARTSAPAGGALTEGSFVSADKHTQPRASIPSAPQAESYIAPPQYTNYNYKP